ncbi:acyltransferase, partial [Testudinibacter sp. TR-2022]
SSNIRLKGNNIRLFIGENVELTGCIASLFTNCALNIGENTTIGRGELTIAEESSLDIGRDCMFAHGYEIRTSDMHPIYSLSSGERLNHGSSIKLGDHIWLGRDVTILKGVTLASNIVVGIRSIVTKSILKPNSVVLGTPASIVKENIVWGRKMYHKTAYDDLTLKEFIPSKE